MNIINLITSFVLLTACSSGIQKQGNQDAKTNSKEYSIQVDKSTDSAKWNTNFLEFIKAIIAGDQKKVKSFIDFPIRNEGNEIWYLADSRLVMKMDPHRVVPFTEPDFDKYYGSIFTIDLRNTLQKLNTKELFLKGNASTPTIEVVKGSTSKLTATYDKKKQKLTLKLVTLVSGHSTGFDINYQFDVLKDQVIKFRGVHVTG